MIVPDFQRVRSTVRGPGIFKALVTAQKLVFTHCANGTATTSDAMIDAYRETDFDLSVDERVRAYLLTVVSDPEYNGFDTNPVRAVDFIEANVANKTTRYRFRVLDWMCNKDGNIHGGAASTMFDNLSSTALFTVGRPGFWDNLGVSRSLSVVFHRPLPLNTTVELTCRVVSAGKRLTHLEAVLETEDGKICASCIHEKVRVEIPKL